jgi:hypothetical protein
MNALNDAGKVLSPVGKSDGSDMAVESVVSQKLTKATKDLAALRKTSKALIRVLDILAEQPQYKNSLRETVRKEWCEIDRRISEIEFEQAVRKDKGQILYTIFFPRMSGWDPQRFLVRTPNTLVDHNAYWSVSINKQVVRPEDAGFDLKREWQLPDAKLMAERAALVASKPREFWCHEKEAA